MVQISLNHGETSLIDESDYSLVSCYKWFIVHYGIKNYYAYGYRIGKSQEAKVSMHGLIMGSMPGKEIDHINGNGLDNRRHNLRFGTRAQNTYNARKWDKPTSSRYKGVTWDARCGKWMAKIRLNYRSLHLGRFLKEEDAAMAYDASARKLRGEFALTNFPGEYRG